MKMSVKSRICALIVLTATVLSVLAGAFSASAVTQSDVNTLKNKLSSVTSKKNSLKKELDSLKAQKDSMAKSIELLDKRIEAAEEEMELQQQLIDQLYLLAEEKRDELAESERQVQAQYDGMRARIRFMAEHGNTSYLSILLSADDFTDFLSKYEAIKQISMFDGGVLDKYRDACLKVEQQKVELDQALKEAETQEKVLRQQKLEYEAELASREKKLAELAELERNTQSDYNSVVKEEEALNASIEKMLAELASSSSIYVGGSMQWPLPAANNVITCKYGPRIHPITKKYGTHTGIDLRATTGTNIYAANDGTVVTAATSVAYGKYVVIDHGGGIATLYAHMSSIKVKANQKVKQGAVIGLVGSTGYSTAPHLHFEVRVNGKHINPLEKFPNFKVTYK